ncbi:hypothetical protein HFD88_009063 [Aspergillus terreus]|nr:hypothetical protein HFD88_009063 [Aspergillus terreus]
MAYRIHLTVRNTTGDTLTIVEKACWHYANGGTWTEDNGQHILSMGGSGTSGMLRFKSSSGDIFSVVLGIHNYKPWCDVQVKLRDEDTTATMLPEYYSGGKFSNRASPELKNVDVNENRGLNLVFETTEGHELSAVLDYFEVWRVVQKRVY